MRPSFFSRLLSHPLVRFCLVGATSTIIDKAVFLSLMTLFPFMPWFVSQSVAFVFGVTNGFWWNRRWTFGSNEHASMARQYPKFFATNIIGLALNLLITKGFLILFTGQLKHAAASDKYTILLASLCAIPLVVVWNFSASHFWTFKNHAPREVPPPLDSPSPVSPPR